MMKTIEIIGRIAHLALKPLIHLAIKNTRRSYVVAQHDGKILMVKNVLGNGKWHLPGGGCHSDELYIQGAIREFKEEVGIDITESALERIAGGPWRSDKGYDYDLHKLMFEHLPQLRIDRKEILRAEWVNPTDLNERNASETTLRAIKP